MSDLWELFWPAWDDAIMVGWRLELVKIKSHATPDHMRRGLATPIQKHGNGAADEYAGISRLA